MTKLLGRRSATDALPDDLSGLSKRQLGSAMRERAERVRDLAAGPPSGEALAEARAATADLKRLRPALEAQGGDPERVLAGVQDGGTAEPYVRPLPPRTKAERACRAVRDHWSLPHGTGGTVLHPENLSDEQAEELWRILERRHLAETDAPNEDDLQRFRALVTVAAGFDPWAEQEAREELARIVEQVRLDGLPRRVEFAEVGSVHLPAALFATLGDRTRTVGDLGALAVVLHALDTEDGRHLDRCTVTRDPDGEPVLHCRGREARFHSRVQPPALAGNGTRTDLDRALEVWSPEWLDVRTPTPGVVELRRGPRAKALREGRTR